MKKLKFQYLKKESESNFNFYLIKFSRNGEENSR